MSRPASDVAFTASVKAEQEKHGSRAQYRRMEEAKGWATTITPELSQFLLGVRSFYLATASAEGQPYIQHRGGPPGFLRPLDDTHLAFADYRGNKQYITAGNLAENPRAFIFVMDYVHRRRLKMWGTARVVEKDDQLLSSLIDGSYAAVPERAVLFTLAAWDRNCPQHIPVLLPVEDVQIAVGTLERRIAELETENARLRAGAQPLESA